MRTIREKMENEEIKGLEGEDVDICLKKLTELTVRKKDMVISKEERNGMKR